MSKAFINCEGFCIASMTDEEAKTYEEPETNFKLMTVKIDTESSTATLDGDGRTTDAYSSTGKTTVEVGLNTLSLEQQALILGHKFDKTTGALLESDSDAPPYVAVGFRFKKSNHKYQYRWYYKVMFEKPSDDVKQVEEGKVTFSTPTLKGTAVYRTDGVKACKWDQEEGTVPANIMTKVTEPPEALMNPIV